MGSKQAFKFQQCGVVIGHFERAMRSERPSLG